MKTALSQVTLSRRLCTLMLATLTATTVMGLSIPTEAWAAEPSRGVTGFQAVVLDGSMTVRVELADRESVRVSPSGASADLVETVIEQRRGLPTLVVRNSRPWPSKKLDVVVTVQGPQFKALSVAGSGLLEAKLSNQPSLQLSVAGSGDLNVQGIVAQQVDVGVAGSGDVRVKGAAQNLSVSVAGSGDAWLRELEAEDVKVSVAGSGDARVNARQRLRVAVAGSGDVRYTGPASNVTTVVTGSGTVRRD